MPRISWTRWIPHEAVDQPYPDTRMLMEALRAQTPPEISI